MNPLISIIVPIYNQILYLDRCMKTILNQTYDNLEIILVDDGSTDGSSELCDQYCQKYGNIKVIHKTNGGISSARNAGIAQANGDYIGFVDSIRRILHPVRFKYAISLIMKINRCICPL